MPSDKVTQAECFERHGEMHKTLRDMAESQGRSEGMFEGISKSLKDGSDTMKENRQNILDLTTKVGELRGGLVWTAWCWVKRRFNGGG